MQQRSEERPGGALKHDRFFGPWPCASTRPMAWPNRLSLCESFIFFVSFATFCSNSGQNLEPVIVAHEPYVPSRAADPVEPRGLGEGYNLLRSFVSFCSNSGQNLEPVIVANKPPFFAVTHNRVERPAQGDFAIFFVSFAIFCSDWERHRAPAIRQGRPTLK